MLSNARNGNRLGECEAFTVKQDPQLVRRADEGAGAGNYNAAKREYEIVLKLQSGSIPSKDSLRKIGLKIKVIAIGINGAVETQIWLLMPGRTLLMAFKSVCRECAARSVEP